MPKTVRRDWRSAAVAGTTDAVERTSGVARRRQPPPRPAAGDHRGAVPPLGVTADWLAALRAGPELTGPEPELEPGFHSGDHGDPLAEHAYPNPVRRRPHPGRSSHAGAAPPRRLPRAAATPARRPHGRRLFAAAFWLGLVGSLLPWWLETTAESVDGHAEMLTSAGRITGLTAGYLLIMQVLLMSRLGWLERSIGAERIVGWHRDLGAFLVLTVLAHAALIIVGYAGIDDVGLWHETRTVLTGYEDMISAFVAAGILVCIGLLGIRSLRRMMPYELWYYLHLTSYAVLLLGYGHLFANGEELALPSFGRYYWMALYIGVVCCLVWGRVIRPLGLNLRHRLRVAEVVDEGPDAISVYITGRRLDDLRARAGQFFRWRFLASGCWWQAHPFSLSAAPNKSWLRLTIKIVGGHTERISELHPGVRIWINGPSGDFTAERRTRARALLVAGGSGIAPIRALIEELPPGAILIYRAHDEDELLFRDELDRLAQVRRAQVWYILGSREAPAPRRALSSHGLRELVPDVADRDVYVCGPPGLVSVVLSSLKRLGVRRRQIHLDPFEF